MVFMLLHFRVSVLFNVISLTLFVASSVTLVCVLVGLSNNILLFFWPCSIGYLLLIHLVLSVYGTEE